MKRILPYIIVIAALTLAGTAAFYSVSGLAKFYAGATTAVIVMGTAIEVSKLIATSILHQYHKTLSWTVKLYLTFAVILSMIITSAGIYGFLVSAYQETAFKLEMEDGVIKTENNKMLVLQQQAKNIETEQTSLDNSISDVNSNILKLSEGLGKNVVQYTDANGNVITTQNAATRKIIQEQLNSQTIYRDTLVAKRERLSAKYTTVNDSISAIEIKILQIKSESDVAAEVGPLRYLSELTGAPMANVVNWFTLLIILIFDPLAVALVIVLNNLSKPKPKEDKPRRWPKIKVPLRRKLQPDISEEPAEESKAERVEAPTPSSEPGEDIYDEKESKPKKNMRRNSYWAR